MRVKITSKYLFQVMLISDMATPMPTPAGNTTPTPTTTTTLNMTTTTEADNRTIGHLDKIFLQTTAAQGIAGAFTFAAILITTYQVN